MRACTHTQTFMTIKNTHACIVWWKFAPAQQVDRLADCCGYWFWLHWLRSFKFVLLRWCAVVRRAHTHTHARRTHTYIPMPVQMLVNMYECMCVWSPFVVVSCRRCLWLHQKRAFILKARQQQQKRRIITIMNANCIRKCFCCAKIANFMHSNRFLNIFPKRMQQQLFICINSNGCSALYKCRLRVDIIATAMLNFQFFGILLRKIVHSLSFAFWD